MWIMVKPRRLTAAFVKAVKVPGRYGDGRGGFGLFLRVHQTGDGRITKSWCQRIRPPHGKPTNIGLGGFPVVSLAEARGEALANRQEIQRGRHPREQGVPTFEEAAAKVIKQRAKGWKAGTTLRQQWEASLRTYAFPSIGHKPVSEVRRGDVLGIVAPIWSSAAFGREAPPPAGAARTALVDRGWPCGAQRRPMRSRRAYPNRTGQRATIGRCHPPRFRPRWRR